MDHYEFVNEESASGHAPSRKKLRIGVVSERAAINSVKTLLENHQLVVQEYDTRNDYGKDLSVDLTEDGELTGEMIAIQVKGGKSYFHDGIPFIPARPSDIRLWADSAVPVVGIVWNPASSELAWVNLTEQSRTVLAADNGSSGVEERRNFSNLRPLDSATIPDFLKTMRSFASMSSNGAYLQLLDDDDEVRREGVFACWTFGRRDARALILLRRLLPQLRGYSYLDAIVALNRVAMNPDYGYSARNWIPPEVEDAVRRHLVWTPYEIAAMFHELEELDTDGDFWQRGGLGQAVWSLVVMDPNREAAIRAAIPVALAEGQIDAAFRLLVAAQWLAEDPAQTLDDLLALHPSLRSHHMTSLLVSEVREHGGVDIY